MLFQMRDGGRPAAVPETIFDADSPVKPSEKMPREDHDNLWGGWGGEGGRRTGEGGEKVGKGTAKDERR